MMLDRRRCLIGAAGLLAAPTVAFARPYETRQTVFQSRGRDHMVLAMTPEAEGDLTGAAILLLHGSGGLRSSAAQFHRQAVAMTRRGALVTIPDYFSDDPNAAERDDTAWWAEAVNDAAAWTATLPGVDPERIGALGYSRGGYLAAETAVQATGRFKAVVGVCSAGNVEPRDIARRPDVLLIHADRDPVIPPERTRRWERILRAADVPVQRIPLRSSSHAFPDETWAQIFATAAGFFAEKLATPSASA